MIQVFSRAWFATHQRGLLALARSPVGPSIFGIDPYRHIVKIAPSYAVYFHDVDRSGLVSLCADFRTATTFARRLQHRVMPVWKAMHYWDALVADGLLPALSFGFDTLIVNPDPGTGNTTVDGTLSDNPAFVETFSNLRTLAGTDANATAALDIMALLDASTTTDRYDQMRRSAFVFDTSSLTAAAIISSATFSVVEPNAAPVSRNGFAEDIAMALVSVSLVADNNLEIADYLLTNWGTTRFASDLPFSSWAIGARNTFALNSAGIANINKTGNTRIGGRLDIDVDDVEPAWVSGTDILFTIRMADQAGTNDDPELEVVFSVAPPAPPADPGAAAALEATVRRRRR